MGTAGSDAGIHTVTPKRCVVCQKNCDPMAWQPTPNLGPILFTITHACGIASSGEKCSICKQPFRHGDEILWGRSGRPTQHNLGCPPTQPTQVTLEDWLPAGTAILRWYDTEAAP